MSPRPGRPRRSLRLRVEQLEPRSLPSAGGFSPVSLQGHLIPNDPLYTHPNLYGLQKIRVPAAWDTTVGSRAVVVADIDSGIDYTHPDLRDNVWINPGEIPGTGWIDADGDGVISFSDLNNDPTNRAKVPDLGGDGINGRDILAAWSDGVDDDGNGYADDLVGWDFLHGDNDPFDGNGHGTHTAGTIGAAGDNGVGLVGVNWRVSVMALQIIDADGSGSVGAAIEAIRYAADNGVRVSNNSWAVYGGFEGDVLWQAIDYARGKGHLVVAAAGNKGVNNDTSIWASYPATYDLPNIISVTATDDRDRRPRWASYGAAGVDLGAPGVDVASTVPGGYALGSGTSMAAPHVAGAAALLLADDPNLTADEVKSAILAGADPVSSLADRTVTGGRLNAARALDPTFEPPPGDGGGGNKGGGNGKGGGSGAKSGEAEVTAAALVEAAAVLPAGLGRVALAGLAPPAARVFTPPAPTPVPAATSRAAVVATGAVAGRAGATPRGSVVMLILSGPVAVTLSDAPPETPAAPPAEVPPLPARPAPEEKGEEKPPADGAPAPAEEPPPAEVPAEGGARADATGADATGVEPAGVEPAGAEEDGGAADLAAVLGLTFGGFALNPPRTREGRRPRLGRV